MTLRVSPRPRNFSSVLGWALDHDPEADGAGDAIAFENRGTQECPGPTLLRLERPPLHDDLVAIALGQSVIATIDVGVFCRRMLIWVRASHKICRCQHTTLGHCRSCRERVVRSHRPGTHPRLGFMASLPKFRGLSRLALSGALAGAGSGPQANTLVWLRDLAAYSHSASVGSRPWTDAAYFRAVA